MNFTSTSERFWKTLKIKIAKSFISKKYRTSCLFFHIPLFDYTQLEKSQYIICKIFLPKTSFLTKKKMIKSFTLKKYDSDHFLENWLCFPIYHFLEVGKITKMCLFFQILIKFLQKASLLLSKISFLVITNVFEEIYDKNRKKYHFRHFLVNYAPFSIFHYLITQIIESRALVLQ